MLPLVGLQRCGPSAAPRELVRDKLAAVFRPDDGDVRRLVSRIQGKSTSRLRVEFGDREPLRATISTSGRFPISNLEFPVDQKGRPHVDVPVLFLPSRELLAMYEGFIAAYQQRELSFDETYFDTAVALSAGALRGPRPGALRNVVDRLEQELGGKVRLEGPRFYLHGQRGRLEAHLMAEGLRKVASVVHLIANGTLRQGGLLIWDEPEANLHPRLAEIGFTFDASHQGQGLASEAVLAVLGYSFDTLGLHRVKAIIDRRNDRAIQLAKRVGMREEALFLQHAWFKGSWCDEYVFAMLASEWAAR